MELQSAYVRDEDFVSDFTRAAFPQRGRHAKLARYVLFEVERQYGGGDEDYETSSATLEHVLPERPGDEWLEQFDVENQERFVARLGNLTPLERGLNADLGNKAYAEKKTAYQKSRFRLTREIDAPHWTPQAVGERQKRMAAVAKTVWSIEFPR